MMRPASINAALRDFHDRTPEQIAAMLRECGVKGRPGSTYGCPLARYLSIINGGQFIVGRKLIVRVGAGNGKARTPPEVKAFLDEFDVKRWPDLVAKPRKVPQGRTPGQPGHRPKQVRHNWAAEVGRFKK
jgi:hypothetical protein